MNLLDELRNSRNSYAAALRNFIIRFEKDSSRLYCFFEGEDEKYYSIRLELLLQGRVWYGYSCGGKAGVLRIFDIVTSNVKYQNSRTAFFIDRDFDIVPESVNDRLYITPCYSIENLYMTTNVLQRILRAEFQVSSSDEDDCQKLTELYQLRLEDFLDVMEELNAWILIQRSFKDSSGVNKYRLNLNNVSLNQLCDINLEFIRKLYSLDVLGEIFLESAVVDTNSVNQQIQLFRREERVCVFRGKFLLEFLRVFMDQLKRDRSSNSRKYFTAKSGVKMNLTKANILSELSQYADTPKSLCVFVDNLIENYYGSELKQN